MRFRKLGNSNLLLSEIGLGTWAIGGGDWGMGWGDQSERDSRAAMLEALEVGVNWIDTAHAYGFGVAEEAVGRVLAEWKDEIIVATKCGVLPQGNNAPRRFISPATIKEEIEASLRRLRVESIDLYQIHWPYPLENLEDSWSTMIKLKEEGKAKNIGVCNCMIKELEVLNDHASLASNQPMYSMLERSIENEVISWCEENSVGILAYSPMQSGLLTGKVSREWLSSLPHNDWRKHKVDHPVVSPLHTDNGMTSFLELQTSLQDIAGQSGRSLGELAVAWVLGGRGITSAIVGARKAGQISQIVNASINPILDNELADIEQALSIYKSKI